MKRSRWLVPAGFFLALSGGGLVVSVASLRRAADPFALVLCADSAPDRRPGAAAPDELRIDASAPFAQANVVPVLRNLRFAVLRCQSPPRS